MPHKRAWRAWWHILDAQERAINETGNGDNLSLLRHCIQENCFGFVFPGENLNVCYGIEIMITDRDKFIEHVFGELQHIEREMAVGLSSRTDRYIEGGDWLIQPRFALACLKIRLRRPSHPS